MAYRNITNKDIPKEEVYELTRILFDNLEDLRNAHSSAKKIERKKPYKNYRCHCYPGAEKYYKEKGNLK